MGFSVFDGSAHLLLGRVWIPLDFKLVPEIGTKNKHEGRVMHRACAWICKKYRQKYRQMCGVGWCLPEN